MRCYLEDFTLFSSICCKMEMSRSVVFDRTSYPPFNSGILQFSPLIWPFTHISMHM